MGKSPVELLIVALHENYQVIERIQPEQLDNPTPCESWTVRDLLDHLLTDLEMFGQQAAFGNPSVVPTPKLGGDWLRQFRIGSDVLIDHWRQAGDLSGTMELPGIGEVPKSFPINQQLAEFSVHTWDLANATGQSTQLDEDVAEAGLSCVSAMLRPDFRGAEADGKFFGPEQPVSANAPAVDRLAAFVGRTIPA